MKQFKVLLVNGSPHAHGNTYTALKEVADALEAEGIATEIYHIGTKPVQGCIACYSCARTGICVFQDEVYMALRDKCAQADGIIIGSPVYYAGPAGSLCALLDRLFYSSGSELRYKAGAAVTVCRRGGASAAFDRLNKYFTILNMPVVSSQYWNIAYGRQPGEAALDGEGMQTMRTLGRNMAWMLRTLATAPHPESEEPVRTNFIR